jgi:hypothetical protein
MLRVSLISFAMFAVEAHWPDDQWLLAVNFASILLATGAEPFNRLWDLHRRVHLGQSAVEEGRDKGHI